MMCTTRFALLLEAMRRLGMPQMIVMQLGFLYRYIFVLIDEAMRVRRARDFRGAALAPVGRRLAAVGGVIGTLFSARSTARERIHLAMAARGYHGEPHSLSQLRFTGCRRDFLVLVRRLPAGLPLVPIRGGSDMAEAPAVLQVDDLHVRYADGVTRCAASR